MLEEPLPASLLRPEPLQDYACKRAHALDQKLAELNLTIDILFLTDAYFNIQYQSAGTTKYY